MILFDRFIVYGLIVQQVNTAWTGENVLSIKNMMVDLSQNKNLETCGYSILAASIDAFRKKSLPFRKKCTVEISNLYIEYSIAENLQYMQAKWDERCDLEVSSSRLQWDLAARERSCTWTNGAMPAKLTRTSFSAQSPPGVSKCFFCDVSSLCEDEAPSEVMHKRIKNVIKPISFTTSHLLIEIQTFERQQWKWVAHSY